LKTYVRSKSWVKPQALLFEAAAHLRLVGHVSAENARLVHDGMELEYWPLQDPAQRLHAHVSHYVLDVQGEKVQPGGTFTMDLAMDPEHFFPPGTKWEGAVSTARKQNVLKAPTAALIRFGDDVYLPVKVHIGITTPDWTEILTGAEEQRPVLTLSDAQLQGAKRHKLEATLPPPRRRSAGEEAAPAVPTEEPKQPAPRRADDIREPDSNLGEDPYSE
jgi:hypothetical protein